jgi:enamine deaminase RidA (YjgF/YER057c/UK114 family)
MGLKVYSATLNMGEITSDNIKKVLGETPREGVCGVVFCGTSDSIGYHQLLGQLKSVLFDVLGRRVPVTLIPQYLLPNGGLSVAVYSVEGAEISIREDNGVCYGIIEGSEESLLFIEGIAASDFSQSVKLQSQEVFSRLDGILSACGFAVDDIVRQWNYIGSIVGCRDGKQNYQEFNDARTVYYSGGSWQHGYPAATGIGAEGEGIVVGCIAFKSASGAIYPIDNPLQVAAHVYSKRVLIDDDQNAMKSTPKFERAKLIETAGGACCFVSGTAAIRGEESVDAHSARLQTIKTIENIEYLVSKENLERFGCKPYDLRCVQLQVFIKHKEDYEAVREEVEKAYPHVSVLYSLADVCRSELLVEIEGILIS